MARQRQALVRYVASASMEYGPQQQQIRSLETVPLIARDKSHRIDYGKDRVEISQIALDQLIADCLRWEREDTLLVQELKLVWIDVFGHRSVKCDLMRLDARGRRPRVLQDVR